MIYRFLIIFLFTTVSVFGQRSIQSKPNEIEYVELAPIVLKPVFAPGKTYRFIATNQVNMYPPGTTPRQITIEQQARYDTNPLPATPKGVLIDGLTERLRVLIRSKGKTAGYDSLKKDNQTSVLGRHFESTVNRRVKVEMNADMKILTHKETGRSIAATPLPGLPRFGPEELLQILNTIPQGYAPDPVGSYDEWVLKGKRPVGDLGELGFDVNYKQVGLKEHNGHQCRVIQFRGHMTGDITDAESRNAEFQGSILTGEMLYDPKIKMTRYSEHYVSMTVNIPDEDGTKKAVPMEQRYVLELMRVDDLK